MSNLNFVPVNEFQPSVPGWNIVRSVTYQRIADNTLLLSTPDGYQAQFSFLSPTTFRVRFRPVQSPDYTVNKSNAVVNYQLAPVSLQVTELPDDGGTLVVQTGSITVKIGLAKYGYAVFDASGQLITSTVYGRNLVYSNQAVACLHNSPEQENYFAFGEKAGTQLNEKGFSLTFFNFDNFMYGDDNVLPPGQEGGPLNPGGPLYNTTPLMLALGKSALSDALSYSFGLFLDNVAQSYFNLGANDGPNTNMAGKFSFGALYGDLDYYIMVGTQNGASKNIVADVLNQFTQLTGRAAMPPMYALGYHQGGYGYATRDILMNVAKAYRQSEFPIDGLHIDVDFQNNYRTFTSSDLKFPNPQEMFDQLHRQGFKCSTNITGIITANPLDETGSSTVPYPTRDSILNLDHGNAANSTYKDDAPVQPFIYNTRYQQGLSPQLFIANENYGTGEQGGINPFIPQAYPSPAHPQGSTELGTYGFYCNMGDPKVQEWWGEQYDYLLSIGLDMIWQDMTCPAVVANPIDNDTPVKTLPLDLMMYDKTTDSYQANAFIHNSFAINLIEATDKGITKLKASDAYQNKYNYKKRNFIIARGGYAGVHRYAGLWTGDSASSWGFMAINIPEVLNLGLSGVAISGCDIGGFANGANSDPNTGVTDPELFTRWMTCGAFLPWYRNHYDGYTKAFQEPYRYGGSVLANCKKYVEMRYRLLQLFYDAAYEATQTGMPIARALFLNDPQDPQIFSTTILFQQGIGTLHVLDCQFFVGQDLLVAPVVTQGTWQRKVYLPAGSQWYVFDDQAGALIGPNTGGQSILWNTPLDIVPVYVREGAIVPIRQLEQFVGELPQNYLTFFIYPGKDSSYQLYQDDHISTDFKTSDAYRLTQVSTLSAGAKRVVNFDRLHDQFTPASPFFYVYLLGYATAPASLSVAGKNVVQAASAAALESAAGNAYFYDTATQKVMVKVMDNAATIEVEIVG